MTKPNPFKVLLDSTEDEPEPEKLKEAPPLQAPKKGRQTGKRSNPDYTQVGAYIPKELDKAVKRKLIDEDIDFSELVANLLSKWLIDNQLSR